MECRKMLHDILKLEKKYNISSTYNVVGKLFVEQPDLIDLILKEGQEIAFHSYNHQRDWKPEYYSNEITLCRKVSPIPNGYRSPRSQINRIAVQTLWEQGFFWTAERDQHSEPYYIYKDLIRLPITADDWPLYEDKVTPEGWVRKFTKLIQNRSYVAFGLHDFVITKNPEEILKAWEKILQIAVTNKALTINFSEAADLFRRATYSKNIFLNSHINKTKRNNFTKEFDELIRIEITKLNKPNVAFLCSQYKELPMQYKELIEKNNYLTIESSADTKEELKPNSIDLLICTDIFEYSLLTDCLADDIKKICKIGGSFIVNFSNSNDDRLSANEYKPEFMNHYFTSGKILRWSNQIGPSYIAKLEDNQYELSGEKIVRHVCIGKVQNKSHTIQINKIIPLSKANFHFPNPVIERYKINLENTRLKLMKPLKEIVKKVLFHS